jgi:hypothetical protein
MKYARKKALIKGISYNLKLTPILYFTTEWESMWHILVGVIF